MWHHGIIQTQYCNIDNNDNMMCASMWFEFLVGYFNVKTCDIWEVNMTTRREIWTKHIHSLGFGDVREEVTLWRLWYSAKCWCCSLRVTLTYTPYMSTFKGSHAWTRHESAYRITMHMGYLNSHFLKTIWIYSKLIHSYL